MKIDWFFNLGPVLALWTALMLTSASATQTAWLCLAIYILGGILDLIHWKLGITPSHQSDKR